MHIPKTGGTALTTELLHAIRPERVVRGFDRCLFGDFDAFETLSRDAAQMVFLHPSEIPGDADVVVGHMAFSTLREASPTGQLVTVLREPVSRLLSHWLYWRTRTGAEYDVWGTWGQVVRIGQGPLADFLDDPRAACQTDNIATRLLLWPHPLIPVHGFIDPASDEQLIRAARKRLAHFAVADIAESPDRTALHDWFGQPLGRFRANETPAVRPEVISDLSAELTPHTLDRLEACTRLDLRLWRWIGQAQIGQAAMETLRSRVLLCTASRFANLLQPEAKILSLAD